MNTFNADTRERMSVLLSELDKSLGRDGGVKLRAAFAELAPFLRTAETAARELATRDRAVRRVVHNFGELSAALAKRDGDIRRFVDRGNVALGELAVNDAPLAAALRDIDGLLPVMRSSFASLRALTSDLDPALKGLEPVTDNLAGGLAALETFGRDASPALRALRPAVRDLRGMAAALEPTSRSLSTALGRLQPQAGQFEEITKYLVPCIEDDTVRDFFGNTVSVLKYYDVNKTYPRAEVTVDTDTAGLPPLNLRPQKSCTAAVKGDK
jgi:hypothetical protein